MPNPTIEKFGYPETLIREFDHWVLLVRPQQPTLGSMVLAAKSDATAYGALTDEVFAEQGVIVRAAEAALHQLIDYERLNYLMLMMVDPNVHFHIIPRYSTPRRWQGMDFPDSGWPGPPDLKAVVVLERSQIDAMAQWLGAVINPDHPQL